MAITFKDFAKEVLEHSGIPLTPQEIWDTGLKQELDKKLKSKGATPWATVGAQLFVDTRDNEKTFFVKVGKRPTRFYLKSKQNDLPENIIEKIEEKAQKEPIKIC